MMTHQGQHIQTVAMANNQTYVQGNGLFSDWLLFCIVRLKIDRKWINLGTFSEGLLKNGIFR